MAKTDLALTLSVQLGQFERSMRQVQRTLRQVDTTAKDTAASVSLMGRAMTAASTGIAGMGQRMVAGFGAARASFVGMIGAMSVGALSSALGDAVSQTNALADAAGNLGIRASELQGLQLALRDTGAGAQVAETGLSKLNDLIGDAVRGNEDAQKTFVALGVGFRDIYGNARGVVEVLDDIGGKLRSADSDVERFSIASQAFGQRNARFFVSALQEMDGGLEGAIAKLREMGLILADDVPQKLDNVGAAFERLGTTITNSIARAIAALEPSIVWLVDRLSTVVRVATNGFAYILSLPQRLGQIIGEAVGTQTVSPYVAARRNLEAAENGFVEARERLDRANANVTEAQRRLAAENTDFWRGNLQSMQRAAVLADQAFARAGNSVAQARRQFAPFTTDVTPPTHQPPPAARPTAPAGPASRETREALRNLERLADVNATPLEEFTKTLREATEAVEHLGARAEISFNTISRAAINGASAAVEASRDIKGEAEGAEQASIAAAEAFLNRMLAMNKITREQLEETMRKVRETAGFAARQPGKTSEDTSGFWGQFLEGAGAGWKEGAQPTFGDEVGKGLGEMTLGLFDQVSASLDKVASGAKSASEAIKEFGLEFVKAVTMMIAKQAALAALRLLLQSIGGGPGAPGSKGPFTPTGPGLEGFGTRMAGGAVAGGHAYIVGERGPEVFIPPGSGMVAANGSWGGGAPQFIVNNNAPGVIIEQEQIDNRTVVAAVNLARTEIARDYGRSMRTGFGPYSEHLTRTHQVRRRL